MVAALVALLASCAVPSLSEVPTTVLHVPGSATVDMWAPSLGNPQGHSPAGSVLICLDTASAISICGGFVQGGLDWPSGTYENYWHTPVLSPGCGTFTFAVDCCYVPQYVTITAEKV